MSVFRKLARGETSIDFVGHRKWFYLASALIILVCLASVLIRGFNFGIEFTGGTELTTPAPAGTTVSQAQEAVESVDVEVVSAQVAGDGYLIRTEEIPQTDVAKVKEALAKELGVDESEVSDASVSASWGSQVSRQALIGLLAFIVAVSIYISVRFEPFMAAGAIVALLHDLVITVGVYSLIGFEVTPSTMIGLLTILGFSLYDTVVVFDKVDENTRGVLGQSRHTYAERANRAINQVLMRSINTSIIALLPVAALLFVGAGLLGAGTLKDLALVLLIGTAAGTYSSICIATPVLVDLKHRQAPYRALEARVAAKRASAAPQPVAVGAAVGFDGSGDATDSAPSVTTEPESSGSTPPAGATDRPLVPRPGVKPQRKGGGGRAG